MGGVSSLLGGTIYTIGPHRVTRVRQLAEGGFSFVDLVRSAADGKQYALKRILCQTPEQVEGAKAEIALHNAISHPFVLTLIASDIQPARNSEQKADEALLLFPLYSHGSIVDVVQRWNDTNSSASSSSSSKPSSRAVPHWPFPEHEALRIFYAICQGAQAIHAVGKRHCDMKPHNVLLSFPYSGSSPALTAPTPPPAAAASSSSSSDGSKPLPTLSSEPLPIIIDLGSADTLSITPADRKEAFALQERAAEHTTASYRAPELFDVKVGQVIDERTDLWSLALVLYFMAFGQSAFENEAEGVMTLAIRSGALTIPEEYVLTEDGQPPTPAASASSSSSQTPNSSLRPPPSRLFSSDFCAFLREMLVPSPEQRLGMKDAMKKSVILMMAALEKQQTRESAAASMATAAPQGEDDFGDFASGTATLATLTPAALDLLVTDMQLGSPGLLKFGRQGTPHSTRLQLTPSKDAVTYTSKGGKVNSIPLTRIFALTLGMVTSKFARFKTMKASPYKPHLAFSLLIKPADPSAAGASAAAAPSPEDVDPTSGEETLDLQAENHQTFRTWTIGLQALLAQPELAGKENLGI